MPSDAAGSVRVWNLLVLVLALAAVLSSCRTTTRDSAPLEGVAPAVSCEGVRETACAVIDIDGRPIRYELLHGPNYRSDTLDAVLVDLGGPGRVLFGNGDAMAFANSWTGPEILIFLEEPWVTATLSESCASSLSEFYGFLHSDGPESTSVLSDDLISRCQLLEAGRWGWTASNYRKAVVKIVESKHLAWTGSVGTSFGAPRVISADPPLHSWAILNSPAPSDMDAPTFMKSRVESTYDALQGFCDGCTPEEVRGVQSAAAQMFAKNPAVLDSRTPSVNSADVASALIATSYVSDQRARVLINSLRNRSDEGDRVIGEMSDSVLLRYGATDISPAYLAYLDEVCRSFNGWDWRNESEYGEVNVEVEFRRLHAPCRQLEVESVGNIESLPRRLDRLCVAFGTRDAVAPPLFARTWLYRFPGAIAKPSDSRIHGDSQGVRDCLA